MRTFDYRHLPRALYECAPGDANVQLYEDKGKLELLKRMQPDALDALRRRAHLDNVEASFRIEGLYVDPARIRALVNGAEASSETEFQVAGYSNALRSIEEQADTLDLSTTTILGFYEALYAHRDLGNKSRYRRKDYVYVQVEGHMQAMPVSPITAFETPLVLGGACDNLAEAFASGASNALTLAAVFTVDLLCIRPFEEGNGRISRLFADLMLSKAGFDVARYVSIDKIIEQSAMGYYDALNACVEGWDRGRNDYTPFALYWFDVVHKAYEQVFETIGTESGGSGWKSGRVRSFVQKADGPVKKRDILTALADVSEATVEAELGRMVKDGVVEKVGGGRSTSYVWCG